MVRMQIGAATVENSMEVPEKIKERTTIRRIFYLNVQEKKKLPINCSLGFPHMWYAWIIYSGKLILNSSRFLARMSWGI